MRHEARTWNFLGQTGVTGLMFGGVTAVPLDIRLTMASLDNASAEPNAWFKLDGDVLSLGGPWTIHESPRLDTELQALKPDGKGAITIDASKIDRLDSAGAVVQAMNTALGTAVEQIVTWALTLPAPPPATP
jgi:ABC-type transporter Mla MlaB component